MKRIALILAVVALTTAQNPRKVGKHGKHGGGQGAYVASSPGGSGPSGGSGDYGSSQYESPAPYSSNQGHKSHHGGHNSLSHNDKPSYSQLIADTRTLNQDGTINFNFQADNGLQQGETVDPDGTRRGFYSYPGADGKPITVKYTAGKNGFIAEGDHLPLQPQAAAHQPAGVEGDSAEYSPKRPKHGGGGGGGGGRKHGGGPNSGHYNPPADHESGAYNPEEYETPYNSPSYTGGSPGGHSAQYNKRPSPPAYSSGGNGGRYQGGGGPGPSPSYNGPPSSYSSPSYSSGGGRGGGGGGPSSFGGFGGEDYSQGFASSPQSTHKHYAPAGVHSAPARGHSSGGGGGGRYSGAGRFPGGPSPSYSSGGPSSHRGGGGFTAANPYQPAGAGPYNGNFDLGNSGHFSIDFAPGQENQYNPGGHHGSPSSVSYAGVRPRQGPHVIRGGPPRGQY